jgi:hypothetical protein
MPVVAASNVPLWAALLVGLGGGVFGTLVGTLLTISHERSAEFRTRMLTAADDFLRTGTQLAQSIGAAEAAIIAKEPDAQVEPLWRAFQESSSRFALEYSRVQLLFGAESRAFRAAVVAVEDVDKARQALRSMRNQPGSVTHQNYEKAFLEAAFAIGQFGQEARRDIRQTAARRRLAGLFQSQEQEAPIPPRAEAPRATQPAGGPRLVKRKPRTPRRGPSN